MSCCLEAQQTLCSKELGTLDVTLLGMLLLNGSCHPCDDAACSKCGFFPATCMHGRCVTVIIIIIIIVIITTPIIIIIIMV